MKIEIYPRRTLLGRLVWDFRIVSTRKVPGPGRRILCSSRQGYSRAVDAEDTAASIATNVCAAEIVRVPQ